MSYTNNVKLMTQLLTPLRQLYIFLI